MKGKLRTIATALLVAALASSCGGGSDPSPGLQDITFALQVDAQPPLAQGAQSQTAAAVIDEDLDDSPDENEPFDSAVELRMVGPMPPGVRADFDRASISPGEAASLIVSAEDDAQPGRHQLLVEGQIAGGSTARYFPHPVTVEGRCADGSEAVTEILASAMARSVALTTSGAAWLWGHNAEPDASGQALVVPKALAFYTAQRIDGLPPAMSAASGSGVSAFVLAGNGELRVLTQHYRSAVGAPGGQAGWFVHAVPDSTGFRQVVAGRHGSFYARRDNGSVWRFTASVEAGVFQFAPLQQVPGFADVALLAAGARHLLALRHDGTVLAMGSNDFGQIGNGGTEPAQAPVPVSGLAGILHIAAGDDHSLAVRGNGTVLAWGRGAEGRLGYGFEQDALRPVEVVTVNGNPIGTIVGVAAGAAHSLALVADGTIWSWGRGAEGQLGTGSAAPSLVAVKVDGQTVLKFAAGGNASFRFSPGPAGAQAWGANTAGQLGDGSTLQRVQPVAVLGLGRGEGRHCREADAGGALSFEDLEFLDHHWQANVVAMPIDGPMQTAQIAPSGGLPGSWRRMVHEMNGPAGIELRLLVVHLNQQAIYDLAQLGAIDRIDYRETRRIVAGADGPVSIASTIGFMQGDRLYAANVGGDNGGTVEGSEWTTATWTGLGPEQFSIVIGAPCGPGEHCPDFSAAGPPITFGYYRQSIAGTADPRYTVAHGIDNWGVVVRRAP